MSKSYGPLESGTLCEIHPAADISSLEGKSMAARSESAATAAISQIEAENPALNEKGSVVFPHLDRHYRWRPSAAEKFLQLESKADILDTLAVNYFAPLRVYPYSASSSYINLQAVILGCAGYYARSKLANIIFAKGLQKEFDSSSSSALPIAVNPGGVATETVMGNMGSVPLIGPVLRILVSNLASTPLDGAAATLYAATSPEIRRQAGISKAPVLTPTARSPSRARMCRAINWRLSFSKLVM
ncbi:hypothetical protein B0H14DRAFT_2580247 [Mycena olivaceomarginata]|nr:hypothetical protein B0H14DRAFT_2580247 [Mycena olivaceomarginata]